MFFEPLESRNLLTTYQPSTTSDGATGGTLRAAIIAANSNAGADTIVLGTGTYGLTIQNDPNTNNGVENSCLTGDLDVTDTLTIAGAGRDTTVIDARNIDRVLQNFSSLTLKDLTITGGLTRNNSEPGGGGILSNGDLTLINCLVNGNTANHQPGYGLLGGGGIYTSGALTLTNSIISANTDNYYSSAIYSSYSGTVFKNTIDNCTISGNSDANDLANVIRVTGGNWSVTNTTISGNQGGIWFSGGALTVANCTFTNNTNGVSAVTTNGSNVTVTDCTFSGNYTAVGGGVIEVDAGTASITSSTFSANRIRGNGGAIYNNSYGGLVTASKCIFSGNSAGYGGAIWEQNLGVLRVSDSTFSGNSASGSGGAVYIDSGSSSTIVDSTFYGNKSTQSGGAIFNYGSSQIVGCTISGNQASSGGGGIYTAIGSVVLANTIVAGNTGSTSSPEIKGTISSSGYNLIGNGTGSTGLTNGTNGDQVGTATSPIDPKLGPLQDNGGPTQTMALLAGSPAIDTGSNSLAVDPVGMAPLTNDQRGGWHVRIFNTTVDIGAFEVQPLHPWQNQVKPLDVSGDKVVATNDVADVIDYLNSHGAGGLPTSAQVAKPFGFADVSGDDVIAPNDVTPVIIYLNAFGAGEGEGGAARVGSRESGVGQTAQEMDAVLTLLAMDASPQVGQKRRV